MAASAFDDCISQLRRFHSQGKMRLRNALMGKFDLLVSHSYLAQREDVSASDLDIRDPEAYDSF